MPNESRAGKAVANEQEVWAAIEIQRHWRGYKGRVHAENAWEQVLFRAFQLGIGGCIVQNWWFMAVNQPSTGVYWMSGVYSVIYNLNVLGMCLKMGDLPRKFRLFFLGGGEKV